MKKFAITGNIASGKSYAYQVIESLGYPIIDCDDIIKKLYSTSEIIDLVKVKFPQLIINSKISLKKLSEELFSDNKLKKNFEDLIFPYLKLELKKYYSSKKLSKKIFVVVPLLFEAGMENDFDKIILITANDDIRKKRLCERKTLMSEYADIVMSAQISQDEKVKKCNYVIENNGTLEEFKSAVIKMLKDL